MLIGWRFGSAAWRPLEPAVPRNTVRIHTRATAQAWLCRSLSQPRPSCRTGSTPASRQRRQDDRARQGRNRLQQLPRRRNSALRASSYGATLHSRHATQAYRLAQPSLPIGSNLTSLAVLRDARTSHGPRAHRPSRTRLGNIVRPPHAIARESATPMWDSSVTSSARTSRCGTDSIRSPACSVRYPRRCTQGEVVSSLRSRALRSERAAPCPG